MRFAATASCNSDSISLPVVAGEWPVIAGIAARIQRRIGFFLCI
jgi:hypothetical protein